MIIVVNMLVIGHDAYPLIFFVGDLCTIYQTLFAVHSLQKNKCFLLLCNRKSTSQCVR